MCSSDLAEQRPAFIQQLRDEYERIRATHAGPQQKLLTIEQARANRAKLAFTDLPRPEIERVVVVSSSAGSTASVGEIFISLEDLVPFIDWSPFFHTWELRGVYPAILQHEKHGEQARALFADAQKLLGEIISGKLLELRGVYGLFPAN